MIKFIAGIVFGFVIGAAFISKEEVNKRDLRVDDDRLLTVLVLDYFTAMQRGKK